MAPGRAGRRPLRARLPRPLPSSPRNTSPSRSRDKARTSSSAATASTVRRRSSTRGRGFLGHCGRERSPRAALRPLPARVRRPRGERRPTERLLAMSGRARPRPSGPPLPRPSCRARGEAARAPCRTAPDCDAARSRRPCYLDGSSPWSTTCSTTSTAMSMAHSLEVRVPFLDHELVEYCATIPPDLKVRRLTTKHMLKQAAGDLLPHSIVHKRKLGFFSRRLQTGFGTAPGRRRRLPARTRTCL